MQMSVESPLVKVVVTSYNRREMLRTAVESVLTQTYKNIHVVIVDDASTDGSGELARSLEAVHPGRVTAIVKARNLGLADSARRGIRCPPRAELIAMLNEDDRWLPGKLEAQVERFCLDPSLGLVFTEALICDEVGAFTGELFSDIVGRFEAGDLPDVLSGNHSCASTHVMRTDIADVVAATLPLSSSQVDYYSVLVSAGLARITTVDTPLAIYRNGSGMHNDLASSRRNTTVVRERVFAALPELAETIGGARAVRRRLAWLTLDLALYSLRDGDFKTWAWQGSRVLRHRTLKPTIWLILHSVRLLPTALRTSLSPGAVDRRHQR